MENIASGLILALLLYGRSLRKSNVRLHSKVMVIAIVLDIVLVTYLSIARDALGKVSPDMSWLLMIHVPIAVSTVVGYFFALHFGFKLVKGQTQYRKQIRVVDRVVIPLRILTFLTSLMLQAFETL